MTTHTKRSELETRALDLVFDPAEGWMSGAKLTGLVAGLLAEIDRLGSATAMDEPTGKLQIVLNQDVKMTRGKAAAQAVHAALMLLGVHPGVPVVVIGGKRREVEEYPIQIRDAGWTEVAPGTLTAGARWGDAS